MSGANQGGTGSLSSDDGCVSEGRWSENERGRERE